MEKSSLCFGWQERAGDREVKGEQKEFSEW